MHQEVEPFLWHIFMSAVNCYHEVVWYALMHLNAAPSKLCLCKWPMVQMRRPLSNARGGEKLLSVIREYQGEKKRSSNIKSNFREGEQRRGTRGWREKEKSEVWGDGGRERLRGLAGSCSSVVARERHVTCCLATLSNWEIAAAAAPSISREWAKAVSMATGHIFKWKMYIQKKKEGAGNGKGKQTLQGQVKKRGCSNIWGNNGSGRCFSCRMHGLNRIYLYKRYCTHRYVTLCATNH